MKCLFFLMMYFMLFLASCSNSPNSSAPSSKSAHETGWLLTHGPVAQKDLTRCQLCHGTSFNGNAPVPSCYQCHLGGPPFFIHPPNPEPALGWNHPVNHGSLAKANLKACQGCHGRLGGPGSNPPFDRALGRLEKGCNSTFGCHDNKDMFNTFNNGHNPGAAHPAYDPNIPNKQDRLHWYGENIAYRTTSGSPLKNYLINHTNAGNIASSCTLCHGANLMGHAEGGVGPACIDCHVLDPISNPSRCVSCHGPLPGLQQAGPPMKPSQLAELVGRANFNSTAVFQTFKNELTVRMKRDPSYIRIIKTDPLSGYYFAPAGFVSYTSVTNFSRRSSHLHHDTLPCKDRQDNATCSSCHNEQSNLDRHHNLSFDLGCASCHQVTAGGGGFLLGNFRDCRDCHQEHFCK